MLVEDGRVLEEEFSGAVLNGQSYVGLGGGQSAELQTQTDVRALFCSCF